MGKSRDRLTKHRGSGLLPMTNEPRDFVREDRRIVTFAPRNAIQATYADAMDSHKLIFGIGPAGTGKTWVCGAKAAEALMAKQVEKLIITRPAVEAGESLGFLPGELAEKFDPYFRPFRHVLERHMGKGVVEAMIKAGRIEALPLALMRGHTFENAFVVLDEAQNTTPVQMKLFLTRIGEGSTVVVNGDITQKDIAGPSGLPDALDRLRGMPGMKVVRFTDADIVRSGMVQDIVRRYENKAEDSEGLMRMLGQGALDV